MNYPTETAAGPDRVRLPRVLSKPLLSSAPMLNSLGASFRAIRSASSSVYRSREEP
jgi:hypothetical protein